MATFVYNENIPNGPNNPSNDQPLMKTNTNSIDSLLNVDHFSFEQQNLDGQHKQVQMPLRGGSPGTIPPGLIANEGTLYTKTVSSISPATETGLFYTPDNSSKEYQLTRTITAQYTNFGTSINYAPPVANQNGGWTFLPGGLILQYGVMQTTGSPTAVAFPLTFPTSLFSLTISAKTTSSICGISTETTSGFNFVTSSGVVGLRFYWQAIGK